MAARAQAVRRETSIAPDVLIRRAAFAALLAALPFLPHLTSDGFEYPAVFNFWVCIVFCALVLLATVDVSSWRTLRCLDVVVLLSFVVALGCLRPWRMWPALLIYPPLAYLAARMIAIARIGHRSSIPAAAVPWRAQLPRTWVMAGMAVLLAVHVGWALQGTAVTDVDQGGVHGALSIAHGRSLYGAPAVASAAQDPHTDTYGPVDYEAYLPFALLADSHTAARLTTLSFDLLTALLLFELGRRARGPDVGVLLAFCWLAYPFTLYEDALGFNDSIVAAGLVATLLAARMPWRRGAVAALACWTKFSPLALLPVVLAQRHPSSGGARRAMLECGCAFALVSVVVFVPAFAHSDLDTFVSRTFGFQSGRVPSGSMWEALQSGYGATVHWLSTASRLLHGLLAALTGAFAVMMVRMPRRQDVVGLAAASAAVLIAVEACLSYYSLSYVLWFAPLVLVALLLDGPVVDVRDS